MSTAYYPWRGWLIRYLIPQPKRTFQGLVIRRGLQRGLDVGCGEASLLTSLRRYGMHSTGIDIDEGMLDRARARNLHDAYCHGDIRSWPEDQTFEVVVACHVVEHLTRAEGEMFLRKLERIATHLVYIETPTGYLPQEAYGGNLHQIHRSGWCPHEFRAWGYQTYGIGLPSHLARLACLGKSRWGTRCGGLLTQWWSYRHPEQTPFFGAILQKDSNSKSEE